MIHLITSLSPTQMALAVFIWTAISIIFCMWFCPRLFRYVQRDDE